MNTRSNIGRTGERGCLRFPGGAPLQRLFDAVVDRIADGVCKRVSDRLDDRPIQFGFLAVHNKLHVFAELREITNNARELRPDVANGLHPRLHH